MNVFVTGAAGTIGARLVAGLIDRGFAVRALVLPDDPMAHRLRHLDCQVVEGDITQASSLKGLLQGIHTVYHLAAVVLSPDYGVYDSVNVQGTANLLQQAEASGVEHFIYVSSASVVYPKSTPYSRSKQRCEQLVGEQTAFHTTVVRPTLVYEVGGGQEFILFWENLKRLPVVPFIGRGRALKNPVHVDDLMSGLVAIAGNPKTYNQDYNLCGGEEITIKQLAQLMLRHSGQKKWFIPVPVVLCQAMALLLRLLQKNPALTLSAIAGITQDANLNSSTARRDLDYRPIGVHHGLELCYPQNQTSQQNQASP